MAGRKIGDLFPNAALGNSEAMTVRLLVGAVISLNPSTHWSGHGHSWESSLTQNCGSGSQ